MRMATLFGVLVYISGTCYMSRGVELSGTESKSSCTTKKDVSNEAEIAPCNAK